MVPLTPEQSQIHKELQEVREMLHALGMKLQSISRELPEDPPPLPKRRGRPPKVTTMPASVPVPEVKRRRGRPPKVPMPSQPQPTSLRAHLEQLLSTDHLDYNELASKTGLPVPKLIPVIQELYAEGLVANITHEYHPRWVWRVGDDNPGVRTHLVVQICSRYPMKLSELVSILRSSYKKISGDTNDIRRKYPDRVWDIQGTGHARTYFLMPKSALLIPLEPKGSGENLDK